MDFVDRFKRLMEELSLPPRVARALCLFIGTLVSLLVIQVLLVNFASLGTSHASTIHIHVSRTAISGKVNSGVSTPRVVPAAISTDTPTAVIGVTQRKVATPVPTATLEPHPVIPPTATTPPVQPPPPAVTLRYSFEDGSTDGWGSDFTDSLQNSTTVAQNGSHALKAVAVNPSSNPLVYINTWSHAQAPPMPAIGNTVSAYVYIPAGSPDTQANVFVEDQSNAQFYSTYSTLPQGVWVHLSYTVSVSIRGNVVEYGIGLQLAGDNNKPITAYIDSVNW